MAFDTAEFEAAPTRTARLSPTQSIAFGARSRSPSRRQFGDALCDQSAESASKSKSKWAIAQISTPEFALRFEFEFLHRIAIAFRALDIAAVEFELRREFVDADAPKGSDENERRRRVGDDSVLDGLRVRGAELLRIVRHRGHCDGLRDALREFKESETERDANDRRLRPAHRQRFGNFKLAIANESVALRVRLRGDQNTESAQQSDEFQIELELEGVGDGDGLETRRERIDADDHFS